MEKSKGKQRPTAVISELEKENAELKRKLRQLEKVIAIMPGHVYLKDANGVYKICNDLQAKDFGYKKDYKSGADFIGKTEYDYLAKDQASKVRAIDLEVMHSEKTYIVEETVKLPDGSEATFLSQKVPFYDNGSKKPTGILGISFDITEYKRKEAELKAMQVACQKQAQEHKEKLSALSKQVTGLDVIADKAFEECVTDIIDYFENLIALMPGHVYWKDCNSIYLGCNNEMAKTVGLRSRHDIVGKTDYDLPWKEKADLLVKNDKEVIETATSQTFEESGRRADGSLLVGVTSKTPLEDKSGKVIGILGISLDITERKRIEEELKQAKKRVEIANNIKTEFIRNMQHDIRTPLSGVFGMAKILQNKEKDPRKREDFDDLVICSKELLGYFDDIIDFSKIEKDTLPITNKKFNFNKLIDRLIRLETPAANIKNLKLSYEGDVSIPSELLGDDFRLYRILMNLVGNAIKFTKEGKIKITTKKIKDIPAKKTIILKITVEDTGIGIPEDKLNYIYEKFSRLHPSSQSRYRGLGLGLRIVKQFVTDLEGNIEVQSTLGKGTKFSVLLPFIIPLDYESSAQENKEGTADE
jgi:PAS domain S-box-containing protein